MIKKSALIALVVCGVGFFIKKEFSFGVLLGVVAGNINFAILANQLDYLLKRKKKMLLFIAGYIVRYALLGVLLYFSIQHSNFLFAGIVTGFFITQALFFKEKARLMQ